VCLSLPSFSPLCQMTFLGFSPSPVSQHQSTGSGSAGQMWFWLNARIGCILLWTYSLHLP
jgi:hypothetical protein